MPCEHEGCEHVAESGFRWFYAWDVGWQPSEARVWAIRPQQEVRYDPDMLGMTLEEISAWLKKEEKWASENMDCS